MTEYDMAVRAVVMYLRSVQFTDAARAALDNDASFESLEVLDKCLDNQTYAYDIMEVSFLAVDPHLC